MEENKQTEAAAAVLAAATATAGIMKELSDIKTVQAVAANQSQNTNETVREIKTDVKEIKQKQGQYLTRPEHEAYIKEAEKKNDDYEGRIRRLEKYGSIAIGAILLLQILNSLGFFRQIFKM